MLNQIKLFIKRIEKISPPVLSEWKFLSTNDIQHVQYFFLFLFKKSFSFNISKSPEKSITKFEKWYPGTAGSLDTYPAPGPAVRLLGSFPGREHLNLRYRVKWRTGYFLSFISAAQTVARRPRLEK